MTEFRFFIRGDLDVATAGALHSDLEAVIATHRGTLVLDCSDLTFLDAAGIRLFIDARRKLERAGRGCKIEHLEPLYRRILEVLESSELGGELEVAS